MSKNHFRDNRINIQNAFLSEDFLIPLINEDSYKITEKKAKFEKLGNVTITGIPCSEDDIRPKSWILDLEIDKPVFANPQFTKTTEKALIVLSEKMLWIFMIEMKNSLQPHNSDKQEGIKAIQEKFKHTIGRVLLLLPVYIFGKSYNDIPIRFKGIVLYQNDNNLVTAAKTDKKIEVDNLYQIFSGQKQRLSLCDAFGTTHEVEIYFKKGKEPFEVEFKDFFNDKNEYLAAINPKDDTTCPIIKPLPSE